jgi:hypothetical protein
MKLGHFENTDTQKISGYCVTERTTQDASVTDRISATTNQVAWHEECFWNANLLHSSMTGARCRTIFAA